MQRWLAVLNLRPEVISNRLNSSAPLGLELHQKVARVRLRDGESQAGTCAARVALDFRGSPEYLLDMLKNAVSL